MATGSQRSDVEAPRPWLRLGLAVMLTFSVLSVPPLFVVLVYGLQRNEVAIGVNLDRQLRRSMDEHVQAIGNLIAAVGNVTAMVGRVVADHPDYFRSDASYMLLWQGVSS